jgi:hypothetical protein
MLDRVWCVRGQWGLNTEQQLISSERERIEEVKDKIVKIRDP